MSLRYTFARYSFNPWWTAFHTVPVRPAPTACISLYFPNRISLPFHLSFVTISSLAAILSYILLLVHGSHNDYTYITCTSYACFHVYFFCQDLHFCSFKSIRNPPIFLQKIVASITENVTVPAYGWTVTRKF